MRSHSVNIPSASSWELYTVSLIIRGESSSLPLRLTDRLQRSTKWLFKIYLIFCHFWGLEPRTSLSSYSSVSTEPSWNTYSIRGMCVSTHKSYNHLARRTILPPFHSAQNRAQKGYIPCSVLLFSLRSRTRAIFQGIVGPCYKSMRTWVTSTEPK